MRERAGEEERGDAKVTKLIDKTPQAREMPMGNYSYIAETALDWITV